jgi:DNA invertase Pin-like site-specific DNA recombinase
MICGIYARKSTEQTGVADEARSVARQIDHARAFALAKGWTVRDEFVYVDDGVSGAEFAARPGFMRLMNALKQRAPFQHLVMSEDSRLGRESISTMAAFKQIIQAGVRIWFYLEDRELALGSMADNTMTFLRAEFAAEERRKSSQRTYDALLKKARAGHVTGGRVFGYDNMRLNGGHVERRVNAAEAAVVLDIYQRYARGQGLRRIAHELNAKGAPTPRPQRGRPAGFEIATVRAILERTLYRGVFTWNRSKKRDTWGVVAQRDRPEAIGSASRCPRFASCPKTSRSRATCGAPGSARQSFRGWRANSSGGRPRHPGSICSPAGCCDACAARTSRR